MTARKKDTRLNVEGPDEDVFLMDDGIWLNELSTEISKALSTSDKEELVEEIEAMSDLVLMELKKFGKKKATSLQFLRDDLSEMFGDKFDVAALDARVREFLDKEVKPRKQTKRQRSPSQGRKSVSKKKKRKSSAGKKKETKKKTTKKKKQTKKQTAKKKGKRKL